MPASVSIILPNYNHAAFLKHRIDSILNQTFQNFELIILDDASEDNSFELLAPLRSDSRVTHFIVNEQNSGSPFKQWKRGLELAKGDFIWIAESDDDCQANFLETQLQFLKEADISVGYTIVVNETGHQGELGHPIFKRSAREDFDLSQVLHCPVLNISTTVFRRPKRDSLKNSTFDNYRIIGDRVFYQEFFFNKRFVKNNNTQCYFRQELSNLSNLDSKGIDYLTRYYCEHANFIKYAVNLEAELTGIRKQYLSRFFNRVRNRLTRREKTSILFLKLYFYHKTQQLLGPH